MPAPEARELDVLDDMAAKLKRHGVEQRIIQRTERELRGAWSGDVYIRRRGLSLDAEIRSALVSGERIDEIARKTGVSTSTIRRRRSRWL